MTVEQKVLNFLKRALMGVVPTVKVWPVYIHEAPGVSFQFEGNSGPVIATRDIGLEQDYALGGAVEKARSRVMRVVAHAASWDAAVTITEAIQNECEIERGVFSCTDPWDTPVESDRIIYQREMFLRVYKDTGRWNA